MSTAMKTSEYILLGNRSDLEKQRFGGPPHHGTGYRSWDLTYGRKALSHAHRQKYETVGPTGSNL